MNRDQSVSRSISGTQSSAGEESKLDVHTYEKDNDAPQTRGQSSSSDEDSSGNIIEKLKPRSNDQNIVADAKIEDHDADKKPSAASMGTEKEPVAGSPSPSSSAKKSAVNIKNMLFPLKLYKIMEDAEKIQSMKSDGDGNEKDDGNEKTTITKDVGFADVISWLPDGDAFRIHDVKRFENEIMPKYFHSSNIKSFQKSLNLWGFKSMRAQGFSLKRFPTKQYVWSHPFFKRGERSLCNQMARVVRHNSKALLSQGAAATTHSQSAAYGGMTSSGSPIGSPSPYSSPVSAAAALATSASASPGIQQPLSMSSDVLRAQPRSLLGQNLMLSHVGGGGINSSNATIVALQASSATRSDRARPYTTGTYHSPSFPQQRSQQLGQFPPSSVLLQQPLSFDTQRRSFGERIRSGSDHQIVLNAETLLGGGIDPSRWSRLASPLSSSHQQRSIFSSLPNAALQSTSIPGLQGTMLPPPQLQATVSAPATLPSLYGRGLNASLSTTMPPSLSDRERFLRAAAQDGGGRPLGLSSATGSGTNLGTLPNLLSSRGGASNLTSAPPPMTLRTPPSFSTTTYGSDLRSRLLQLQAEDPQLLAFLLQQQQQQSQNQRQNEDGSL